MLRTPTQKSTKEDTWKQLVTDYKLDGKMYDLLMTTTMDDLEDLRFYWQSETEIKQFVDRLDGVNDDIKRLQCSRLCRVWHNYRQWATTRDAGKSHQSTAELDDLLEEITLAEVQGHFFGRAEKVIYKRVVPNHIILIAVSFVMSDNVIHTVAFV